MIDDAEIIGAFRERLLAGAFGDRELLMPIDADYSGMWSALCDMVPEWERRYGFDNPVLSDVRNALHAISDARPNAVEVFALATTRYGREQDNGQ